MDLLLSVLCLDVTLSSLSLQVVLERLLHLAYLIDCISLDLLKVLSPNLNGVHLFCLADAFLLLLLLGLLLSSLSLLDPLDDSLIVLDLQLLHLVGLCLCF